MLWWGNAFKKRCAKNEEKHGIHAILGDKRKVWESDMTQQHIMMQYIDDVYHDRIHDKQSEHIKFDINFARDKNANLPINIMQELRQSLQNQLDETTDIKTIKCLCILLYAADLVYNDDNRRIC